MSLSQVQLGVAITLGLISGWAALIMAVALSLPKHTQRAENVLNHEPRKCFLTGLGVVAAFIGAIILMNMPTQFAKLAGIVSALAIGGVLTLGGAGIAQLMGTRIGEMSGAKSSFGALVRGSFVYSFAMLFPLIGWWVFAPLSAIFALGAGFRALRRERHTLQTPVIPSLPQGTQGAV